MFRLSNRLTTLRECGIRERQLWRRSSQLRFGPQKRRELRSLGAVAAISWAANKRFVYGGAIVPVARSIRMNRNVASASVLYVNGKTGVAERGGIAAAPVSEWPEILQLVHGIHADFTRLWNLPPLLSFPGSQHFEQRSGVAVCGALRGVLGGDAFLLLHRCRFEIAVQPGVSAPTSRSRTAPETQVAFNFLAESGRAKI